MLGSRSRPTTNGPRGLPPRPVSLVIAAMLGMAGGAAGALPALAQQAVGQATGFPLPRYVSLRSDRVNLREGPSRDHRTTWVYLRAGLPMEITAESDTWRRVRDSAGTEGWVLKGLLSGKRTALVAPWKKDLIPLRGQPLDDATVAANLQAGVLGNIRSCDGTWCRISGDGYDGYLQQTELWGVYPGEKVD